MSANLGGGSVSFRLGSITPSKVYRGSAEAWSAAPPQSPPSPPVGLVATMVLGSDYDIATSWEPPLVADPAVTDYEVRFTPEGWNEAFTGTFQALTGGALEYLIDLDAMQAGIEWEIRVRAINAVGSSEWSESVYITVALPPAAIASVTATASETAESAADISWGEPDNGGAAITGYNIYTSEDFGTTWTLHGTAESSPYELILPYRGGNSVYVDVRAENLAGEGPSAGLPGGATLSDSVPGPLTITGVTQQAGGDLYVEWTEPEYSVTPAISEYEIAYEDVGPQSATTSSLGYYTLSLPGSIGQEIAIQIRAINSLGAGPWSEAAYQTVADVPSVADYLYAQPSMSAQGAIAIDGVMVPASNGAAITSYDVQLALADDFSSPVAEETFEYDGSSAYTDGIVSGLAGGTTHYIRIRFTNAVGDADWSNSFTATSSNDVPSQVTGFSVTANGSNWDFAWTPANDGGSALSGYEIQDSPYHNEWLSETGMQTYSAFSYDSSTSAAITGSGIRYFRIRAVNGLGNGEWSDIASAVIPSVPEPPTITSAYWDGYQTRIAYTPGGDGNSEITGYAVFFDGQEASPDGSGSLEYYFIPNYHNATATMTATNAVGPSDQSDPVNVLSVPGSPYDVSGGWDGNDTVVTYSEPSDGGSAITGYVFKFAGMTLTPTTESTGTATFSGSNYSGQDLEVAATNEFGTGLFSSPVTVADNS